jgi:hypothetical protein
LVEGAALAELGGLAEAVSLAAAVVAGTGALEAAVTVALTAVLARPATAALGDALGATDFTLTT